MSADRVEGIRARADAATPGAWRLSEPNPGEVWSDHDPAGWDAFLICSTATRLNPAPDAQSLSDAEFVAHSRADVPWLLDRLSQVERELTRARAEWQRANERADHERHLRSERDRYERELLALKVIGHVTELAALRAVSGQAAVPGDPYMDGTDAELIAHLTGRAAGGLLCEGSFRGRRCERPAHPGACGPLRATDAVPSQTIGGQDT